MNITEKQKKILDIYNINYDTDDINKILEQIDNEMTKRFDKEIDSLNDEGQMLQDLYDELYYQN